MKKNKSFKRNNLFPQLNIFTLENGLNLLRGEAEKTFIYTGDACYRVNSREIECNINTILKIRYKSGKTYNLATYTASGVSKCAPGDKFNLLTGIKLATARAENDYNTYYFKLLDKYFKSISTFASRIDCLRDNCMSQLIHNNQHFIPSLIDKEDK